MWASKTYLFSPSTVIKSDEVNQNFDDMVNQLNTAMPSGAILMWSGSIASIPAGWLLCDGTGGTPNLRNRFIVGAGDTYAVGATGGATTHTHSFSATTSGPNNNANVDGYDSSGNEVADNNHTHTLSGTTGSGSSLPPYYALAFIMKS